MSNSKNVQEWRNNTKLRALRCFGNKCQLCGYSKCIQALEFHHIDPSLKDFSFSSAISTIKSWEYLVTELKKCVLVCTNCHREIHYNNLYIEPRVYFNEQYEDYQLIEGTHKLCVCGTKIPSSQTTCSNICKPVVRQKINWAAELNTIKKLKDIDKLSFVKIAAIYGVSDKTIAKWYYK